jgi:hypothetical protein
MDLRTLTESQLQKINERLIEFQQINFDDPDLEQAELQAMQFVEARRGGRSGKTEMESDDDIKTSVSDFLKKRSCYRPEKETRDLSITYPEF